MKILGGKSVIAFVLGENWESSKNHQHIDIWVNSRKLNPVDNVVYLPTFYTKLKAEIGRIAADKFPAPSDAETKEEIFSAVSENLHSQILNFDVSICAAKVVFLEKNGNGKVLFSYWDNRHEPKEEIGAIFEADIDRGVILNVLTEALKEIRMFD